MKLLAQLIVALGAIYLIAFLQIGEASAIIHFLLY